MNPQERAAKLRDQVRKTWRPPLKAGRETAADIAQTSVMQSLAWCFGREFLGDLSEAQAAAISQGLAMFERALSGKVAGVALDAWKLPIFERELTAAGFSFELGPGVTSDSVLLRVPYVPGDFARLEALLSKAQRLAAAAARRGAALGGGGEVGRN